MPTDAKKEAMRDAVFAQSFEYGIKPRHGLFSQPVSTAIGDNHKYVPIAPRRDPEDGLVMTDPRNFYTTKGKSGKTKPNVYFMNTSFIACGDPF